MLTETVLLEQNKRLREENEELHEKLRQFVAADVREIQFPDWVPRMTPLENSVLVLLCNRDFVTAAAMQNTIHDGDVKSANLLSVIVCRLRKKLKPHGVEIRNLWGKGYRMTDASKALLVPTEAMAA